MERIIKFAYDKLAVFFFFFLFFGNIWLLTDCAVGLEKYATPVPLEKIKTMLQMNFQILFAFLLTKAGLWGVIRGSENVIEVKGIDLVAFLNYHAVSSDADLLLKLTGDEEDGK